MLSFPDAPTTGQKYAPGAGLPLYVWDGQKWTTFTADLASKALPSNASPLMDGAVSAGSSTSYSRGNHVHPTDTVRAPLANATFTGTLTASLLSVTNVSAGGRLISTTNGHSFGWANGTGASGAVLPTDANIKFYDHSGANGSWCGIGTDGSGNIWVRTGYSGNPVPVFYILNDQSVYFRDSPLAPTPGAGDNSTKLATTAFVMGRTPSNAYPLAGGTVTGNVTIANTDIWIHQNNNYGVLYLGNTGARYLQWDGTTYNFNGAHLYAGNGRLFGTGDWGGAMPYNNARLAYITDMTIGPSDGTLYENWAAGVRTGMTGTMGSGGQNWIQRYRQFQYYTNGWFAIGYA